MRKLPIFALAVAVCLTFGLAACTAPINENTAEKQTQPALETKSQDKNDDAADLTEPSNTKKDVLVVYFSATGTTKKVAERIAALTNADLYEIVPAEPYSEDDLNYSNSQSRATIEMNNPDARPEIGGESVSLDGYSTIYIGYPIWWGDVPRIVSTFAETYDFSDITVIPFCTSGGSGIGNSGSHIAQQAGSGNWLSGQRFSLDVSDADLQSWIDGLQSQ